MRQSGGVVAPQAASNARSAGVANLAELMS
jgi:hypothetical protein